MGETLNLEKVSAQLKAKKRWQIVNLSLCQMRLVSRLITVG